MCRAAGIAPPAFEEITGAAVITFRVPVGQTAVAQSAEVGVPTSVTGEVSGEVTGEVARLLEALRGGAFTRQALQATLGLRHEDHFRTAYLMPAIEQGLVEMTVPGKPTSRLQRYRLTSQGRVLLALPSTKTKE